KLVEHDGQQPDLVAVVEEDVGERRRDDRPEAVLLQGPGRVLATGATSEVLAREQDRGPLVTRLVQHEVGIERAPGVVHARLAPIEITQVVEQVRAKPGALDGLQELLGNDEVGIDVLAIERGDQTLMYGKSLHANSLAHRAHIDEMPGN